MEASPPALAGKRQRGRRGETTQHSIRNAQRPKTAFPLSPFSFLLFFLLLASADAAPVLQGTVLKALPNGLRLIVREQRGAALVAMDIWVRAGSVYERENESGCAHFLEHLLFKGTQKRKPGEIDATIEDLGALLNAATTPDAAHFYTTVSSRYVEIALETLADALQNSTLEPAEVERERQVILDEIARSQNDRPKQAIQALGAELYKGHPYSRPVLGLPESIRTQSRETIAEFYRRCYAPNNMTVVLVGDISPQSAEALVTRLFGSWKSQPLTELSLLTVSPPFSFLLSPFSCAVGYRVSGSESLAEVCAGEITAAALGRPRYGRLAERFSKEKGVSNPMTQLRMTRASSLLMLYAEAEPEKRETVRRTFEEEIKRLQGQPLSEGELLLAQRHLQGAYLYEIETYAGQAFRLGSFDMLGDYRFAMDYSDQLHKITGRDIQRFARRFLKAAEERGSEEKGERRKEKGAEGAASQAPTHDSTQNPLLTSPSEKGRSHPTPDAQRPTPPATRYITSSRVPVIIQPDTNSDFVAICVLVKAGMGEEGVAPGLPNMVAYALFGDNVNQSREAVQRAIFDVGGSLRVVCEADYTLIECVTTKAVFEDAFYVIGQALKNAQFDPAALDDARRALEAEIDRNTVNPYQVGYEAARGALYQSGAYRAPFRGTKESLRRIKPEAIQRYYQTRYIPTNTVVAVVGNISRQRVEAAADNHLFDYDRPYRRVFAAEPSELTAGNQRLTRALPVKTTTVMLGYPAPAITHPDFPTFQVMTQVIGGGKSSRLFRQVRDTAGIGYIVSAEAPPLMSPGFLLAYAEFDPTRQTANGQPLETADVERKMAETVQSILTQPPSLQEIERAKRFAIGTHALAHQRASDRAFYLGWYELLGLGYAFDAEYPHKLEAVTPEMVQEAAKRYLHTLVAVAVQAGN